MQIEPIWADYVTYDDDGFVNGISGDAPKNVREAFEEYQRTRERESGSDSRTTKY